MEQVAYVLDWRRGEMIAMQMHVSLAGKQKLLLRRSLNVFLLDGLRSPGCHP